MAARLPWCFRGFPQYPPPPPQGGAGVFLTLLPATKVFFSKKGGPWRAGAGPLKGGGLGASLGFLGGFPVPPPPPRKCRRVLLTLLRQQQRYFSPAPINPVYRLTKADTVRRYTAGARMLHQETVKFWKLSAEIVLNLTDFSLLNADPKPRNCPYNKTN